MLILNKNILTIGGNRLEGEPLTPPEPPGPTPLQPNTIRVKFSSGYTPAMGDTQTLVDSTNNVWDIYKESNDWNKLFNTNTNLLEVISANTTNVTNMARMFYGCSSLTSIPLFVTSSVTNMGYMFYGCSSLTSIPLFVTSSVTTMSNMFYNCTSLTTVPLFDTSSVTDMGQMFYGCTSLTTVPLFVTSNVTQMGGMFRNCTSLTTVPLFNTSSVTDMGSMFHTCTSLTSIPLFNTSSVLYISSMVRNCTNVQSGALALYQQASTQTTPPTTHINTFLNCGSNTQTGAAELAQIPSDWGGNGA